MFFSDDLLSSKKGSFGIIWLAATLGPKTKRITRKQLTGVDLTKTCELIAEPPEPLALRLSGCLLVGVARVYNQNYDLFYTDVTKFHSDLRRMVLTDFGAPTGPGGQPIGLDLVGDGKAKIDQITFGGEDASWLSNFNPDFLNMRWLHPKYAARDRQASTQLSSLQSQQSQDGKGSLADDSDEETDDSDGDDDDAEIPRRGQRKSRNNSSPEAKKSRVSKILPSSDPGGDVTFPQMDGDLFPGVDFTQNGPDDSSLVEPNHPPSDLPTDFPQDPNVDINPDGQGQTTPKATSEVPTGEDGGPGAQIPQQGSMASVEEVDGLVEPEKKKKKVKKTKKVKFDDDLEIEYDALRDANYVQRMTEERADMKIKERNKLVDERATALVDGGGDWTGFFDPEMKDLFSTISRPGKFQWENDHTVNGLKFYSQRAPEPEGQDQDDGRQNYEQEPYGPDITGQSAPFVDHFQEFEVPVGLDEPEMARRQSQSQSQRDPGEGILPWANEAFADSDDFGPDNGFTPGSRLSNMTPLEKKIRQSSGRNSFAIRGRQERSPSVLGEKNLDPKQLVSDEDANDFNLDDENFDAGNLPASQMRRELPDAFQPHMLASLETQCRDFMAFTERKMFQEEKTELDFDEIIEEDSTKKVAALAFYNCLTLATKKILSVSQPTPWETITLRFSADL